MNSNLIEQHFKKVINWKFFFFIEDALTIFSDEHSFNYSIVVNVIDDRRNTVQIYDSNDGYLNSHTYSAVGDIRCKELINSKIIRYGMNISTYGRYIGDEQKSAELLVNCAKSIIKRVRTKYNICCNDRYNDEPEYIYCNGAGQILCDIKLL